MQRNVAKPLVLLLALVLANSAVADEPVVDRLQGCWKTEGREDMATNTITFCIDGQSVQAAIFYPNKGHNSTTCRSLGQAASIVAGTIAIRLLQGSCENGRNLAATDFECTLLNEYELNCLDASFNQLHLKRESDQASEQ